MSNLNNLIPFHSVVTLQNGKELKVGNIEPIGTDRVMVELLDSTNTELLIIPYYMDGNLDIRLRGYLGNWRIKDTGKWTKLQSMADLKPGMTVLNSFGQEYVIALCERHPNDPYKWIVKYTDETVAIMIFQGNGCVSSPVTKRFTLLGYIANEPT